jgi:hypothetical protein
MVNNRLSIFSSTKHQYLKAAFVLLFALCSLSVSLKAQSSFENETVEQQNTKSPRGAFLRSLVLPGWGHHYLGEQHVKRARFHFGSELILVLTYFGLDNRANSMNNRMNAYVASQTGIQLSARSRAFQIALSQYNSLAEYNDFMERTRNWNQILPNTPENQWYWESDEARNTYVQLRDDRERATQQLPGLVSLMVVNRVLSSLNAFTAARKSYAFPELSVNANTFNKVGIQEGFTFTARFNFK